MFLFMYSYCHSNLLGHISCFAPWVKGLFVVAPLWLLHSIKVNQIFGLLYSPKSPTMCLEGLHNLYKATRRPLDSRPRGGETLQHPTQGKKKKLSGRITDEGSLSLGREDVQQMSRVLSTTSGQSSNNVWIKACRSCELSAGACFWRAGLLIAG